MSDINEAYARIDYAFLKNLSSKINKIEDRLDKISNRVTRINGKIKNIDITATYANRQTFEKKDKTEFSFGSMFNAAPVVTLSVKTNDDSKNPYAVITSLSKDKVQFRIIGGGNSNQVHCIAIGETE